MVHYRLNLTILFFFLSHTLVTAQNKYFVKFADKNSTPYSIDNPSEFLSQRAIDRRTNQNISINETDLPVDPSYLEQVKNTGASLNYPLKWFNGVVITISNSEQLTSIQSLSFVTEVKEIFESSIKGSELEVDVEDTKPSPTKNNLETTDLNYGSSSTQIKMLNGHILHNSGYLGDGIQIAVLDAGFLHVDTYSEFDSARIHNRILGTKDFVNPTSNIYNEHYHGMMVLSTMAGYVDGELIGTAPHAKYWLIRTEDANNEQIIEEYNWAAGAEFADSVGADIINTSLGYTTFDVSSQNHFYSNLNGNTTPITIAANIAASKGLLVVVSAGNDGDTPWHYISAPADSPNIITAGAVNSNLQKASFSSFGPTSDGRIKPDVCTMGQGSVVVGTTGVIGTANGTSFSAPILSGMLACLWQAKSQLSAQEIINLTISNSSQYLNPDNERGYGIPNFANAVGIINIYEESSTLKIYPNPFNGNVRIVLPNSINEQVEYRIFSIIGEMIINKKADASNGTIEINLPDTLPTGNYFFKVITRTNIFTGKGIKN